LIHCIRAIREIRGLFRVALRAIDDFDARAKFE
jgi:hypothetical protein